MSTAYLERKMAAVLEEFIPTFLIIISEFGIINPATIKNDAEEKSPGISIFIGFNFLGGETFGFECFKSSVAEVYSLDLFVFF